MTSHRFPYSYSAFRGDREQLLAALLRAESEPETRHTPNLQRRVWDAEIVVQLGEARTKILEVVWKGETHIERYLLKDGHIRLITTNRNDDAR